MCWTRWGSCAESPRGRGQLTQGENSHSKATDGTWHQIHHQSTTIQLTGSPDQEARSVSNRKKCCLLRHGSMKMRDFSPGLITGGKVKSRSHLPVIPNEWLKRASGDFPLAGEQALVHKHLSSLLLECPSFLPLNPSILFFS